MMQFKAFRKEQKQLRNMLKLIKETEKPFHTNPNINGSNTTYAYYYLYKDEIKDMLKKNRKDFITGKFKMRDSK